MADTDTDPGHADGLDTPAGPRHATAVPVSNLTGLVNTATGRIAPVPEHTERKKPWWRRVGPMLTATATVIGAIIGVVQVVPLIFNDSTSLSTLEAVAKPYRADEVFHYVLPLQTDFSDFPFADSQCSENQLTWLESKGQRFQRDYLIQIRNTAGSGSVMALQNFRATGDLTKDSEGLVLECDKFEGNGVVAEPAHLRLDTNVAAYFDKSTFGKAGTGMPNLPLGYNLAPGETGQIVLTLSSIANFSGQLVVSGSVGKETRELPIELEGGTGSIDFFGASTSHAVMLRIADGTVRCEVISTKESFVCELSKLVSGVPASS